MAGLDLEKGRPRAVFDEIKNCTMPTARSSRKDVPATSFIASQLTSTPNRAVLSLSW